MGRWLSPFAAAVMFAAVAASRESLRTANERTLLAVQQLHADWLTAAMKVLSEVGDTPGAAGISTAGVLVLVWLGRRRDALRLALVMILGSSLNAGLKQLFADPRPDLFAPLHVARGHSFPSGHAQAAVALYGSLALLARRRLVKLAALLLAAAICVGRIYLGVHWPTDVIAGMLVGTFALAIGFAVMPRSTASPGESSR